MSSILLTGASGFVGSHVLPALLGSDHHVRALVRSEEARERVLEQLGADHGPGLSFVTGEVGDPESLRAALEGIDAVVHLVAIPRDRDGGRSMALVNTTGTANLVEAMASAGVDRLVHLGAMGVRDDPRLHYSRSKAQAEEIVRRSGLRWTVLRPSLLWGERDGFFNIIASLIRTSPGMVPVPAGQESRFQPLWVGDLAAAIVRVLADEASVARTYELGGPEYWTYREMVDEVLRAMGRRRLIVPLPLALIKLVAGSAEALRLPFPVATDQLRQLAWDNTAGLDDVERELGLRPRPMRGNLGYLRHPETRQRGNALAVLPDTRQRRTDPDRRNGALD